MLRSTIFAISAMAALAACNSNTPTAIGPDGKPLPDRYIIGAGQTSKVQNNMLDSVNSLRQSSGLMPVQMDSSLTAAAKAHSVDISIQNRAWHFGSDGSSPIDRIRSAGYSGHLIGENISETYEDESTTLNAWMEQPSTRSVIMSPAATRMGFAWEQTKSGKLWWTLIMAN